MYDWLLMNSGNFYILGNFGKDDKMSDYVCLILKKCK